MRTALLAVLALLALGPAEARIATHRFEDRIAGFTVVLPSGWHAAVFGADGSLRIATYPVLWTLPWARRIRPLPAALPQVESYEGFGSARSSDFRSAGHEFLAFVKGRPRNEVLRILGCIQVTAYGRRLANVHTVRRIGRSVEGRPIRAWHIGNPRSKSRTLVVGCIHGNECAGTAITQQLVNLGRPIPLDLWVIQDLNPDGLAAGTRQNAHGVDLNRNFGAMWTRIGRRGSLQYSGPRPWSERETRIARSLVLRIHPKVTIWFHQPQALVRAWGGSIPLARRFARLAHVPFRAIPWPNGTAANWQNHLGEVSFVVELPPGQLSLEAARRYARALLALDGN